MVYFRILLKRGQTHSAKIQGGKSKGGGGEGNPIINVGKANNIICKGRGQTNPKRGGGCKSTPWPRMTLHVEHGEDLHVRVG